MTRTRRSSRKQKPAARPTLTRPQFAIYSAGWTPEARFRTAVCGRRFGKTFLAVEELRRACRLAVQRNVSTDNEIWYAAPNFKQAKRVFWRRLKKGIPSGWLASKPNETDCSIVLTSGHIVRCVGLDNYDALRGSGLWFVVVDEWADCPPEAWSETLRPMLSTAAGNALFIGTPKGFDHLRDSYVAGQPGGKPGNKSFMFTTLQGGNVPPDEVATARAELDLRTFRQEYEASFETFAGRVLYAFTRADSVRQRALDAAAPLLLGIDFNINPMSCTVWQSDGDVLHQVDEIILSTSNTDELVSEIRRRYARSGTLGHVTAYPDPAGAQRRTSAQGRTDIGILKAAGMRVVAMSSHPLVRDRINVSNARFLSADGKRRAFVDPRCTKSIEAYERLAYRDGSSEPDKGSGYDHLVDATGYLHFGLYAYKPPQTRTVNVMGR